MIYTVGDPLTYGQLFREHGNGGFMKRGRDPIKYCGLESNPYRGGTVFRDLELAWDCAARWNYCVYYVDADWDTDVEPLFDGCDRGDLLRSAPVFWLEDEGEEA